MSRRVIVRSEAETDITETAAWYEGREPSLGFEFLIEVQTAISRAQRDPDAFLCLRKDPEVRRVLTKRFPYRLFFIVRPDAIVVFAVLHAARHDRNWKRRLS
jgi:toxin ParE1/3/4